MRKHYHILRCELKVEKMHMRLRMKGSNFVEMFNELKSFTLFDVVPMNYMVFYQVHAEIFEMMN